MASNTSILIKRSRFSPNPSTSPLKDGELAYSYASNTLFIGNANTMFGYDVIGGEGLLDSLSSNLTISDASSNTANVNLKTDTLKFRGSNGVTANVGPDMFGEPEVVISLVEGDFVKSNTGATNTTQIITTGLQIDGDLIVNGTTTTINSTTVETGDAILVLANNNTSSDSTDIGFVGKYHTASGNLFTGLIRDSSYNNGEWALITDYEAPGGNDIVSDINISSIESGTGGKYGILRANIVSQSVNTSKLRTSALAIQLGVSSVSGVDYSLLSTSIAIGGSANANTASDTPNDGAIAIGYEVNQGVTAGISSVAIGRETVAEGQYSIAIGHKAQATQDDGMTIGSIVLNATDNLLTSANTGFYVAPVRQVHPEDFDEFDGIALYNSSTKEMRFTRTLDGGSF